MFNMFFWRFGDGKIFKKNTNLHSGVASPHQVFHSMFHTPCFNDLDVGPTAACVFCIENLQNDSGIPEKPKLPESCQEGDTHDPAFDGVPVGHKSPVDRCITDMCPQSKQNMLLTLIHHCQIYQSNIIMEWIDVSRESRVQIILLS